MDISTKINLTSDEKIEISAILGCDVTQLNEHLNASVGAALEEYLTMFRGQKVLKRGSDILEYRLFLLMKHAFNGTIPDEKKVCNLFQTTLIESRSLIRAVISKYQYQLRTSIETTMRDVITRVNRENEGQAYLVIINSHNIIDEINRLLADIDGSLTPVTKKKGSVSTYQIQPSSYNQLKQRLNSETNP